MYAIESDNDARLINFVGLSVVIHFSAFIAVLLMKVVLPEIKPVIVEIEIIPPKGQRVIAPLIHENKLPEVQMPQPAVKTEKPQVRKVQMKSQNVKANKLFSARTTIAPIPVLETPALEVSNNVEVENLSEDVLKEDFEKIDNESEKKLEATTKEIARAHKQALLTHEESLSEVTLQAQQEAERMTAISRAKRRGELAALAASRRAAAGDGVSGQGEKNVANKQGPMGSPAQEKYGVAGGVLALEDIRQKPGNKKPQYDYQDRLAGRQGEIVFITYISKAGTPVQFKMVKGTGHSELDTKTLKALKEWRFYPGQEGWVEIPFRWDLKGGPQEMPATLRRKISRN